MRNDILRTFLEREIEIRTMRDAAQIQQKDAEEQLLQAESKIHAVSRVLPFLGKDAKATVEAAKKALERKRREAEMAEADLNQHRDRLDTLMLDELRRQRNSELTQSESMIELICKVKRRIEIFNSRVADFRKALGQARGAMSACYDRENKRYSPAAIERIGEAVLVAKKLDSALAEVNDLARLFQSEARGTPFENLEVPRLEGKDYAVFVRKTSQQPIGLAQFEFEKMLDACEQLNEEDVGLIFQQLEAAEQQHATITREIGRKAWKSEQAELLKPQNATA